MNLDASLHQMTATQLATGLKRKAFSAAELCDAAIARIEALDEKINAVVVRDFERARTEARMADDAIAKGKAGALTGIPMTVKESFDLRGQAGAQDVVFRGSTLRRARLEYAWLQARTPGSSIAVAASSGAGQASHAPVASAVSFWKRT